MSERNSSATDLAGKTAIVTGSSKGIGRAIAEHLARRGASLVVTARTTGALSETAESIRATGGMVECVATPDGEADRVVQAALDRFEGIDILINNAGTTKTGDFLKLTEEDWADGYKTKVFGAMRHCRVAWPYLKARHGCIINIAGVGGRTPDQFFTIGGSVNAAVMAYTKALAQLGIEDGVRVNAINPGLIKTGRLIRRIREAAERWNCDLKEAEERMMKEHHIARFGTPEEIAKIIGFLVSDEAMMFQGAVLDVDAGFTKGL